ncbi:hypothetical protein ACFFSW_07350 [Saccharothrix longispora]|uniref:GyrI-like small molecule binding protein n=1 Tax=Saccharothrix longispora TaxID=33920 RepID=A0ABU1PSQ8_9PSEU|nr:hypothetical protein [Saccharothrix longispora]MDR6593682.1 hypothetical protein [Saccharothrix longispora]
MDGLGDVETGVVTHEAIEGDDRVRADVLPAGRYAGLAHVDRARRADRALPERLRDSGITPDRWDEPAGDHFACRYEAHLTDPRSEPRKTTWRVQPMSFPPATAPEQAATLLPAAERTLSRSSRRPGESGQSFWPSAR